MPTAAEQERDTTAGSSGQGELTNYLREAKNSGMTAIIVSSQEGETRALKLALLLLLAATVFTQPLWSQSYRV